MLPLLRHVILNDDKSIDQLPADRLLRAAQDRILDWWHAAYRSDPQHPLAERFGLEAAVSLPGIAPGDTDLDACYSALNLQRLRLKQNQQVPEWSGERYL